MNIKKTKKIMYKINYFNVYKYKYKTCETSKQVIFILFLIHFTFYDINANI